MLNFKNLFKHKSEYSLSRPYATDTLRILVKKSDLGRVDIFNSIKKPYSIGYIYHPETETDYVLIGIHNILFVRTIFKDYIGDKEPSNKINKLLVDLLSDTGHLSFEIELSDVVEVTYLSGRHSRIVTWKSDGTIKIPDDDSRSYGNHSYAVLTLGKE